MNEHTANRIAGALALAWLPLLVVGFGLVVGFSPAPGDPDSTVVDYYRDLDAGRAWFGEWIEALSFLALLGFVARVAAVTRVAGAAAAWLGTFAVALAASAVAIAAGGIAVLVGLARDDNAANADPALVATLDDVRIALHWLDLTTMGALFIALGTLLLVTRVLGRAAGWAAVVSGLVLLVGSAVPESGIADIGAMLAGLWAMFAGALVLARPARLSVAADSSHH